MNLSYNKNYKNLQLAKSHALYRLSTRADASTREQYLQSALGNLFFLEEFYLAKTSKISRPSSTNKQHVKVFSRLAIIENNIGAAYEMMNLEKKALKHYWRSIDYSKRVARENEIANLNIRLSVRRKELNRQEVNLNKPVSYPLIMDFIPPQLNDDAL